MALLFCRCPKPFWLEAFLAVCLSDKIRRSLSGCMPFWQDKKSLSGCVPFWQIKKKPFWLTAFPAYSLSGSILPTRAKQAFQGHFHGSLSGSKSHRYPTSFSSSGLASPALSLSSFHNFQPFELGPSKPFKGIPVAAFLP